MSNVLELRTVNELRDYKFLIPSYQRGYRWSVKQVVDLLNDISEFRPKSINDNDGKTWYCLQPIVVKKNEEHYEVIDGQQRLTTIYLILHYLNQYYVENFKTKLFDLTYETRDKSSEFLKTLNNDTNDESNIDFFFISKAFQAIVEWFQKDPGFNRNDFESKFKFNTKVIWFESNEADAIAIFTRINIGKIPLTNAELIKALFLNSSNFEKNDRIKQQQFEIATEWDAIEQTLQDDKFWYFLNGDNVSTNRIEFIFNLMNDNKDIDDNYSTFRYFNQKFKSKNKDLLKSNWGEIKNYHQRFIEWYNERDLYHKIGYLVTINAVTIKELYDYSIKFTKTQFRDQLDKLIKRNLHRVSLENLVYGDENVKKVLLLYNILTMLNNENDNSYFPFDIYKNEKWDIEHITSVADSLPLKRTEWLNDAKVFIDESFDGGTELRMRADNCNTNNDEMFETLFKDIVKHFNLNLKDEDINDISNLALLDSQTNRGYKNAVFPLKRKTIIDREKKGTFIPICTKNVFLKYFNDYPPKISFWTQEDRDKYYLDLEKTLKVYLKD